MRWLGQHDGLFAYWRSAELETCRQRVAVEAPYELHRHPEAIRSAWLAAYAHMRGRAVTDTLVELLIEVVYHIGARAEHRVESIRPPRAPAGKRQRRECRHVDRLKL